MCRVTLKIFWGACTIGQTATIGFVGPILSASRSRQPLHRLAHPLQTGRERPGAAFWAALAQNFGVAPAQFSVFSFVAFSALRSV